MTAHFIVVGLPAESPMKQRWLARLVARGLTPVNLESWQESRLSIYPRTGELDLRVAGVERCLTRASIRSVLMFGRPALPPVPSLDSHYQAVEYDALLFGLCMLAAPLLASRWSYIVAGYSDTIQAPGNDIGDPLHLGQLCQQLFRTGSNEAVVYRSQLLSRLPNGEVIRHPLANSGTQVPLPITLELDAPQRTFTPFVGLVPDWLPPESNLAETLLDDLESDSYQTFQPISGSSPLRPKQSAASLTIVAPGRDVVATHLLHRSKIHRCDASLLDLNFLYSPYCPDDQFESALESIRSAELVFARPLLFRRGQWDSDDTPLRRHVKILRVLQQRTSPTLNPAAAGHTNMSKAAHGTLFRAHGLPIPPTLVTNDATAALAFIDEHTEVIYKSISWTRSLVSRFTDRDRDRLPLLERCPTTLQSFVDGANCRAHLLFGDSYPVQIVSSDVDYRSAFDECDFAEMTLDAELSSRLWDMARYDGLSVCGCDLRWSSAERRWIPLEINPIPAFSYYDHVSGNRVADAILHLTTGGTRDG